MAAIHGFMDHGINDCIRYVVVLSFESDSTHSLTIWSDERRDTIRAQNERTTKKNPKNKFIHTLHLLLFYHFENLTKFESTTFGLMVCAVCVCVNEHIIWVMMISIELSLWSPYVNICRTNRCARASEQTTERRQSDEMKCAESR